MRAKFPLLAAVIVMVVLGYALSQTVAVKLWRVGVPVLREDLRLLVRLPVTSPGQTGEFPPEAWPRSVRTMDPLGLRMHREGVLLLYDRSGTEHEGLLVMLDSTSDPGPGGSGVGYDSMGEGVYWCREKVRAGTKRSENIANGLDAKLPGSSKEVN